MNLVYLGLGSNLGESEKILQRAIDDIDQIEGVFHVRASRFYETVPVSSIPQPNYVNAAVQLETILDPHSLFKKLQEIERKYGKVPKPKEAPRLIDIDILTFGELVLDDEILTIPHPRFLDRLFVLTPLLDLTDSYKDQYLLLLNKTPLEEMIVSTL